MKAVNQVGVSWACYVVSGRRKVFAVWRDLLTYKDRENQKHRPFIVSKKFLVDLSKLTSR